VASSVSELDGNPVLLVWILEIHFIARQGKIHGDAMPPQTGPTTAIGRIGSILILTPRGNAGKLGGEEKDRAEARSLILGSTHY
jgi:hypothetical protein